MELSGALAMAPKPPKGKGKSKGRGRPKATSPLHSIVSLKGSDELEAWLERLTEKSESGTRTNTLRRALKLFAEAQGMHDDPIPRR